MLFPPFGRGRRRFSVMRDGHGISELCLSGARRLRWEVLLILSGAALAAASEGLFVFVHSGFRDKDFPCGGTTQGIK